MESEFKGSRTGTIEVTAFDYSPDGYICGLRSDVGEVYLIYASPMSGGRAGRLYAGACGVCGSGPLAQRAEAARQLRTASAAGDTLNAPRSDGRRPGS